MEDVGKVVRERGVTSVNLVTAFSLRTRLCPPLTYFFVPLQSPYWSMIVSSVATGKTHLCLRKCSTSLDNL